MRPEEARKLLGGYATGTLTDAERQALFAAALEDQQLFDELAREQTLHELLRDPGARAEMLDVVAERPRLWAWWRPAAAAVAVAAIAAVVVVMPRRKVLAPAPPPQIVAEVKPPQPIVVPPPAQIEAPAPEPRRDAAPARKQKAFQPPPPPPPPVADTAIVEAPKASASSGVVGGVPGGVMGGTPGGVLGGIISSPRAQSAPPPPPPPPIRFDTVAPKPNAFAPSTADTVQVTAEAAVAAPLSARALFYGGRPPAEPVRARLQTSATMAVQAPATPRDLGLRYSVVRKDGDAFIPADPEKLGASDVLAVRFTANVNGYLSIAGGKPVALTAMEPYTTPPLEPGVSEVRVIFARSPQTTIASPVTLLTEVSAGEVYVVNRTPNAPVAFTVTLKRK